MSSMERRETASPLEPDLDREGHGDITGKPKAGAAGTSGTWSGTTGTDLQEGMTVYGANDQMLGRIDRVHGTGFDVAGQHYGRDSVLRVDHNRVYVRGAGTAEGATGFAGQTAGEVRVPVAEEQLQVGKREVEQGAVEIRKTVTEERQTVPVTLRQEEVRAEVVDTPDRPLRAGEQAFREGTIRVPVRGEEAVVAKEAVVTGEVVIDKEQTTRQEQVSGTVRREHVDVDENYRQARAGLQQDFQARAGTTGRTWEQAEPHYRTGFTAAHDDRYAGREFADAEPELRREYETSAGTSGDRWEQLREEVRTGWDRARGQ
jgi:uncharacterized protein (TIGR02271 family)